MRKPEFNNLLTILDCGIPNRPTLFEFFLHEKLYEKLAGQKFVDTSNRLAHFKFLITAFKNAGYDYATVRGSDFQFPLEDVETQKTRSLNQGYVIKDRKDFDAYTWPSPEDHDYSALADIEDFLPEGMKLIVYGPGGVLENVISLVGYDNLCYMLYEDPNLIEDIFEKVGSSLVKYYEICAKYDSVGALISNDDWGFKTQPMLSPQHLRKYVFPWHKRITEVTHNTGKPVILHSCGNIIEFMDEIIYDMKYDGKHSFEDAILPVEEVYKIWHREIAILGGIDVDFLCRASEVEIVERCKNMLKLSERTGSYALGSGNSIPEYVPDDKYFAMISVINE